MNELSADDSSATTDATAEALVRVGNFTAEDPCILEAATAPWDNTITSLSRGPFRQEVAFLSSSGLILYRETTWNRTRVQGLSPPGMFVFTVPLRIGGQTSYWGTPLHETGLPVMMPGGVHADFSAGQQHLIVLIDLGLFRKSLSEDLREAIERTAQAHVIPASRYAVARLGASLNAMVDGAQADPQALQHPHAVLSMEQDLLAAFRGSLMLPPPVSRRVGRAKRQHGLERAVDYLRYADAASVTIPELLRVARTSERTLEYAFLENFGLSPLGYLILRRYHAARKDLVAADGKTTKVGDIAQINGFYQMGRFAVRYKKLFGESPSHTLMRPPMEAQHRFRH
jgi:AraC family ethanolamine operon transcriptional activator